MTHAPAAFAVVMDATEVECPPEVDVAGLTLETMVPWRGETSNSFRSKARNSIPCCCRSGLPCSVVHSPDDEEIVWPEPGQVLFKAADSYDFAWVHGADWYDYREGFLSGAQALLKEAVDKGPVEGDRLAFPVVFMYRHYLELAMKGFIRDNARFAPGASAEFEKNHDLPNLWQSCHRIIEGWWPGQNSKVLEAVGCQIAQLALIDPKSMAFRYPVDKKGRRSLPDHLQSFDLAHFAGRTEAIGMWLDGADAGLHEEASWRADAAAEYESELAELRAEMMADFESDNSDW